MREYIETDKNVRQLKAQLSVKEHNLYLRLQTAIRDAALKVLDAHTDLTTRVNIMPVYDLDGDSYLPDLVEANLRKLEGDAYTPTLSVSLKLRIPGQDNPAYDPEQQTEYY